MTESELLLYVGIWTVCAVGAWFIATTKKAPDAGQWAVWGLLLGPLGVLAAIAFAKPRTGSALAGRLCSRCMKPVGGAQDRCANCGSVFAEYPPL